MPYVSARYAPSLPPEMAHMMPKEGVRRVIATDHDGVEWQLTDDSQVGDWLRYVAAGGEVTPYQESVEEEPSDG